MQVGTNIELLHMDCMEYMRGLPDKAFDLCIVDPPYGIGAGKMKLGANERKYRVHTKHKRSAWDANIPPEEYFVELERVAERLIIWGANYFTDHLPPSRNWIIWDKGQAEGMSFAMHEMAWASFDGQPRIFYLSHATESNREFSFINRTPRTPRIHPTQKPVALYRWLLKNYAKPGQRILDTHLGSGSIAIACDIEGFDLVGTEIDADYIAGARKRLADHRAQPRMFDAPKPTATQLEIDRA
jgi:site-specific DNA-methyltransferase (adenine-specific)